MRIEGLSDCIDCDLELCEENVAFLLLLPLLAVSGADESHMLQFCLEVCYARLSNLHSDEDDSSDDDCSCEIQEHLSWMKYKYSLFLYFLEENHEEIG